MQRDLLLMFGVSVLSGLSVYFLTTRLQRLRLFAHDQRDNVYYPLRVTRKRSAIASRMKSLTGGV